MSKREDRRRRRQVRMLQTLADDGVVIFREADQPELAHFWCYLRATPYVAKNVTWPKPANTTTTTTKGGPDGR